MTIRDAVPGDGPTLARLNEFVHGLHLDARPDFFRPAPPDEAAAWLASLADGPATRIWIAEADRTPVGYVLAYFHERPARPFTHARRWCEIDQIAVDPRWRRQGAARALTDAVLDGSPPPRHSRHRAELVVVQHRRARRLRAARLHAQAHPVRAHPAGLSQRRRERGPGSRMTSSVGPRSRPVAASRGRRRSARGR